MEGRRGHDISSFCHVQSELLGKRSVHLCLGVVHLSGLQRLAGHLFRLDWATYQKALCSRLVLAKMNNDALGDLALFESRDGPSIEF